eukprot:2650450-Amphidinium_carterae.1
MRIVSRRTSELQTSACEQVSLHELVLPVTDVTFQNGWLLVVVAVVVVVVVVVVVAVVVGRGCGCAEHLVPVVKKPN